MKTTLIFLLVWVFADLATPLPTPPVVTTVAGFTDNPEARKDFERGLLLLHNFEYPDAAELFRSAQRKDSLFAMAYWGEAMTYNHPIWLSQDLEEAREVLRRYKMVSKDGVKKLPSLDADLMRSLEILYGKGSKAERDKAYAEFMSGVYERNRGNHDVAAFYALALLGQAGGWDEVLCGKSAMITAAILKENPKHPGALHYFIHAEDHPEFANRAWNQANDYSKVASYSGHALHMPSHIYLALGLWDDVVKSNEISWKAGVDRKEAKKLTNNALNYHAHWWLEYGYLQQGRFSKAEGVLNNQLLFTLALPSPVARTHFVIMRGHYLVESNDWKNSLSREDVKINDLRIEIRNVERFVRGLKAVKDGDKLALATAIKDIEEDLGQAKQAKILAQGVEQCGTPSQANAGANQAGIMLEELKALSAYLNQDMTAADAHFKRATALEDENGHFYGPPEILKPAYEFYGEFLLATGKYRPAVAAFQKALQKTPGRNQALSGLKTCYEKTADRENENKISLALKKNMANAETSEVKSFFSAL